MDLDDLPEEDKERIYMLRFERDPEAKLAAWREVVARYPAYTAGRLNYANVLLTSGRARDARDVCEALLREEPNERGAIAQLALIELAEGAHEKVIALADRAAELGYPWAPALAAKGEALAALGDVEAAKRTLLDAYERHPHGWNALERYCELSGRPFVSPMDEPASPVDVLLRQWLFWYVETIANTPDEDGEVPGCDHTFRFVRSWAELAGVDLISLYQFVNSRGGFCDCEVIYNTEECDLGYGSLVLAGGLVGDATGLREWLAVREQHDAPEIAADDEDDEDDEGEQNVLAIAPGSDFAIPPQRINARAWGRLVHAAHDSLGSDALFWAVVRCPSLDETRLFVLRDGVSSVWLLDDAIPMDAPADIHTAAEQALTELLDATPADPDEWHAPVDMLVERPGVPRLLFQGEGGLWVAYADGSASQPLGLLGFNPAPSPDGRHLAYTTIGAVETLNRVDVETGEHLVLERGEHFGDLTWVDDEVRHDEHAPRAQELDACDGRIARVDAEGAPIAFLTDGPHDEWPVSHPSGWVAFQRRDAERRHLVRILSLSPAGELHELEPPGQEATWWPT